MNVDPDKEQKKKDKIAIVDKLPSVETSVSTFRLRSKMVHLTYKSWSDHKKFLEFFNTIIAGKVSKGMPLKLVYWSLVNETSDETQAYEHTHVALSFNLPLETTDPRFFDAPAEVFQVDVSQAQDYETKKAAYLEVREERLKEKEDAKQQIAHLEQEQGEALQMDDLQRIKELGKAIRQQRSIIEEVDRSEERYTGAPITEKTPVHPNIQKVTNVSHWNIIVNEYHHKTGVPVTTNWERGNKLTKTPTIEEFKTCETSFDVVKMLEEKQIDLAKTGPMLKAWRTIKDEKTNLKTEEEEKKEALSKVQMFRPWQREIYEECVVYCKNDDRSIIWIVDTMGGCGKSTFTSVLEKLYSVIPLTASKMGDAALVISDYLEAHPEGPECIIFNLDRTTGEGSGIYTVIEAVKDGMFTSPKYHSRNIKLPKQPKVIVMANTHPDVNKLSLDRWDIRILEIENYAIKHRILGSSAMALYEVDKRNEEKGHELSGTVYPVEAYDQIIPALELQHIMLMEFKMIDIITKTHIITDTDMKQGIPLTTFEKVQRSGRRPNTQIMEILRNNPDDLQRRKLTNEEIERGFTYVIEATTPRDMTQEEKENYIRTRNIAKQNKDRERQEWALSQRKQATAKPAAS